MGMEQSRKEDAVYNAGYYIIEDQSFAYIPEAGLNLEEAFRIVGMADVVQYKLTHADGSVLVVNKDAIPSLQIPQESDLVTIEAM
jgi:hypothetical protein